MSKFTTDTVIGLEIHVELDTDTKLFCGCPTEGEEPNSACCETCLGMPGSKPVLNKKAVEYALRLCLALNCKINPSLIFSRKTYFYPDMAKNYQITQYEEPLGKWGSLPLDEKTSIGITRVHIEEDPAALVHPGSMQSSPFVLVDYNRSGRPLCEVVTEPEMTSPEQARDFMRRLITILNYLEIFDQQHCIIKADANISIKDSGYTRVEVKNITGFKEIERALQYEIKRQRDAVKSKEKIIFETRAWDAEQGMTFSLRSKESEEDYGYILDPDLVPIDITQEMIAHTRKNMPELAHDRIKRYISQHKIPEIDAKVIAEERKLAELFEKVAEEIDPVLAAQWLRRELVRVMNYTQTSFEQLKIDETHLIELLGMVEKREITDAVGKKLMEKLIEAGDKPFSPREHVKREGLGVVSDTAAIEKLCAEAIAENAQAVKEFREGNEKSFNYIVGQVMKKSRGKAAPKEVNEILKGMLE